jgi:hypothetical protein
VLAAAPGAVPVMLGSAHAQSADIEAVWSFNGGEVAVQKQPDGSFVGTVVRETRLATCPHPVGEKMWIDVRAQPDGQYFGRHQWYRDADCSQIPDRGNTAYRVLARPDGKKFLRVCFGKPETPDIQPKIAPDGSSTDVNQSCADSDLVSPLAAGTPKLPSIVKLPSQGKKRCLSRRAFTIRLKEPSGDALDTATVYVNRRRVETRRRDRITAPINLRGLPKGRYTVKIVAKTVLGRTIQGTRKYRTCSAKRRGANRGPL